jgi:hypothetical protein
MDGLLASLKIWQEIDLTSLVLKLDEESASIVENQKDSLGKSAELFNIHRCQEETSRAD